MKTLKRFGLLALALLLPTGLLAQGTVFQATDRFQSSRSSPCYDLTRNAAAANYFLAGWRVIGTVSGGTIKVQQSASNDCSNLSDLIADADATANGQSAVTQGTPGSIKVTVTSYAGTGTVASWVGAWVSNPAASSSNDTELPAAAALADNTSNPTVPGVGAFLMCFDGSTWDRCPVASGGAGESDANTSRTVGAQQLPFRSLDLDETEEEVKATAGELCMLIITNTATATRWVKVYNATAANVTVGTTTPIFTFGIPGNSTDDVIGGFAGGNGCFKFDTAITLAATTGVADADTGAPAANDVIVNAGYR